MVVISIDKQAKQADVSMPPPRWSFSATARLFTSAQHGRNVPKHSWSVFHPSAAARAALHPVETLRVTRFPHLNLVQTRASRRVLAAPTCGMRGGSDACGVQT